MTHEVTIGVMDMVRVALLGLGAVGSSVYAYFINDPMRCVEAVGDRVEIAKVLVRDLYKKRSVEIPSFKLTTNSKDILGEEKIDIVVILLSDAEKEQEYTHIALTFQQRIVLVNPITLLRGNGLSAYQFVIDHEAVVPNQDPAPVVWSAIGQAAAHIRTGAVS